MNRMQTNPCFDDRAWTLAGGTALALRYGHRISVDLDFFRCDGGKIGNLADRLSQYGTMEVLQDYEHTLTV
jgi:hypothetical protein